MEYTRRTTNRQVINYHFLAQSSLSATQWLDIHNCQNIDGDSS
ncbi:MAG: hypothetical protein ACOYLR_00995 [Chlorobium sp.]